MLLGCRGRLETARRLAVTKLIVISLGGWAGWWLGGHIGILASVLLSALGSGVGLYIYNISKKS
jgi:hypothetical protein